MMPLPTSGRNSRVVRFQRPAMAARTAILDDQVRAFIANDPDAVIVNLGAGLDTRFNRRRHGKIEWIELDLPDGNRIPSKAWRTERIPGTSF